MITIYTGTPGSGKSYHAALTITQWVKLGKPIVANFTVDETFFVGSKSTFLYLDNSEMTPAVLATYAMQNNARGKEGQMLLVIDEAQVMFNCRSWNAKSQQEWVKLFSQHRKLGLDVLLIAQSDRMIDRQIRYLIEVETKHRKLNNYGFGGKVLSLFTGGSTWFVAINYWYGGNGVMLDHEMIRFRKKVGALYDSYAMFDADSLCGLVPVDGSGAALVEKEMARRKANTEQNKNYSTKSEPQKDSVSESVAPLCGAVEPSPGAGPSGDASDQQGAEDSAQGPSGAPRKKARRLGLGKALGSQAVPRTGS